MKMCTCSVLSVNPEIVNKIGFKARKIADTVPEVKSCYSNGRMV
jgi:hypothetical protein